MSASIDTFDSLMDTLCSFVLNNRRGSIFKDWTADEVRLTFKEAAINLELLYAVDGENNVKGIIHGRVDKVNKVFHVSNILTVEKWVMPQFLMLFDVMWPGYSLVGNRHGHFKVYNLPQFRRKLQSIYV